MDLSNVLRTIAELSSRAVRADRDQQRRSHDHRSTREALRQATADLEEVAKLADVLYRTSQRMGAVIDYLLKKRGANSQEPESLKIIMSHVLHELENQREEGGESPSGNNGQQRSQMAQATRSDSGPSKDA
ncbi:hypothetical protein FE257_005564 [Aspergillus nanangensis]|uniref:Uncharacterized protein n=1 Tax=Aspergillus nanangensis TaxID=2582783 RepID=A0AAD4GWN7_ASPNN|nr:hypothetical protein FE257_005564 [Aspergillus nanangensis]